MTAEQLANEFIKQGWILLPPPGSLVRVKRASDPEPLERRVDEIEIEVDLSFTLWHIVNGNGDGFGPEDIIEFISIPEGWGDNVGSWWRQVRE